MENIQILHQALQDEHDVLFAMNGQKALHIAQHQLPDLILLDAMMPDMDGYAVCAALRASEITRRHPDHFRHGPQDPGRRNAGAQFRRGRLHQQTRQCGSGTGARAHSAHRQVPERRCAN
ncbi:response regulator [Massilia sp. H-1]|nr:response regulator [Massilia sp. H-1]